MPFRERLFARLRPPAHWLAIASPLGEALSLLAMLGFALVLLDRTLPPQHLPWRPLALADPIGIATRAKLLRANGRSCRAVLAGGGLSFRETPPRQDGFCRLDDTLVLAPGGSLLRPASPLLRCREALAYALWRRQVVEPEAARLLGSSVVAVEHYGSYACRRRYGRTDTAVSEHAFANALDVAAFRLADGRTIEVQRDWVARSPKGEFLHRVRDGACRVFNGVLSPDYNAAHHNHLHLDMGGWTSCN